MKTKIFKYTGALFSLLLFSAALWVLHREVRTVHLQYILSELGVIPGKRLWLAAVLTFSSYTIMAGYDYLAIRFIRHSLSLARIALASFIGYAFSNNIGFSMLAGASVRYRLYSGWGLSALEITKVVAFCTLSLWLGLFSMGGMVFVLMPMGMPSGSFIPFHTTFPIGVLLLAVLAGYVTLTAFHRQPVHFMGWEIPLPSLPMLCSQILVACVDWLLGGAVLYTLLPFELPVSYWNFIGVYFLAQIAGLISQVPGGLGVFETAMVMMIPHSMNAATPLLGALVAYRGIYYLLPLGVATALLGIQEVFRGKENAYIFKPAKHLQGLWVALQGTIDEVCEPQLTENFVKRVNTGRLVLLPKVGHGFSVPRNWLPQFREEFLHLAAQSNLQPQSSKADLQDLPLVEVPADTPSKDVMAVILSGDGGWAGIDREVAGVLAKRGIAVVGLNSLKYFWTKKTPEIAADDLSRILRVYLAAWKKGKVVLVGYSFGADVLPFMANRLEPDLLNRVVLIALLGPANEATFEFHLTDWLGGKSRNSLPVLPEVAKLADKRFLCIHGEEEKESLCSQLSGSRIRVAAFKGAHHFGGSFEAIANLIVGEVN